MELSDEKQKTFVRRILLARMKVLLDQSFFGLLLMHVKMGISDRYETAWTDNQSYIYFNPQFLDEISDRELIYVLEHEIMHIVLKHLERMDDGGFNPELYNVASDIVVNSTIMKAHGGKDSAISLEKFNGPQMHVAPDGREGSECTAEEIYLILEKKYQQFVENVCNKLKKDGYISWDVHDVENDDGDAAGNAGGKGAGNAAQNNAGSDLENIGRDETKGQPDYNSVFMDALWKSWILNAAEVTNKYGMKGRGTVPGFVERYINDIAEPKLDWRAILNEFVQEEINDYSFTPPDRRFSESPFFLPDYNDADYSVKKLLFMIDTSGSMSDEDIKEVYSEVKGAIDQFNGKLQGWLGFFDGVVYPPEEFSNEDEFAIIRPRGGGGTSFDIIFDYVRDKMTDDPPVLIIILTDGYAPFPEEKAAYDNPALWILTTDDVNPPWGKVARLKDTSNGLNRE